MHAYEQREEARAKEQLAQCWQTASFCGAAFAGKLRPLRHYMKDAQKAAAPRVDRDEFERKLKAAREGRRADGAEKP